MRKWNHKLELKRLEIIFRFLFGWIPVIISPRIQSTFFGGILFHFDFSIHFKIDSSFHCIADDNFKLFLSSWLYWLFIFGKVSLGNKAQPSWMVALRLSQTQLKCKEVMWLSERQTCQLLIGDTLSRNLFIFFSICVVSKTWVEEKFNNLSAAADGGGDNSEWGRVYWQFHTQTKKRSDKQSKKQTDLTESHLEYSGITFQKNKVYSKKKRGQQKWHPFFLSLSFFFFLI